MNSKKEGNSIYIPINILKDRVLSPLESLIEYLKEEKKLSYKNISILINRDQRNVWTIYNRVKKKRENGIRRN